MISKKNNNRCTKNCVRNSRSLNVLDKKCRMENEPNVVATHSVVKKKNISFRHCTGNNGIVIMRPKKKKKTIIPTGEAKNESERKIDKSNSFVISK